MSRSVLHIGTGYGGSLYGLTRAGFKVVKSIDRDPQCIELARLNFPDIDFMNISLQAFANTRIVDGEDRLSVADAYPVDLIWASYSLSGVRTFPSKTPYRSWVLALENIIQQYETPPKLVISMHGNPGALRAEDHFEQYYDQSPGCCLVTDPLSSSLAVNFSLTIYGYSGDKFVQIKAIKKSLGPGEDIGEKLRRVEFPTGYNLPDNVVGTNYMNALLKYSERPSIVQEVALSMFPKKTIVQRVKELVSH